MQHIQALEEDGYDAPSRILRISSTDLKSMLKIKGGLAADLLDFAAAAN